MSTRKTNRDGSLKSSLSSLAVGVDEEGYQQGASSSSTPAEAPPKVRRNTTVKEGVPGLLKELISPASKNPGKPSSKPAASGTSTKAAHTGENKGKIVVKENTTTVGNPMTDMTDLICKEMEDLKMLFIQSQEQVKTQVQELQARNEARFARIEAELSSFVPAVDQRFNAEEQRVAIEETGSQVSMAEIQKVEEYLQQEEIKKKNKEEAKDQEIHKIEGYLENNQEKENIYKKELEDRIDRLIAINQAQQKEIEKLKKLNWSAQVEGHQRPIPPPIQTIGFSAGTSYQQPQRHERSAVEDFIMTDAYPVEYERDIPMFNGESSDMESFLDRLNRYFGRHQRYYQMEPMAMVYFIVDHLQGRGLTD